MHDISQPNPFNLTDIKTSKIEKSFENCDPISLFTKP